MKGLIKSIGKTITGFIQKTISGLKTFFVDMVGGLFISFGKTLGKVFTRAFSSVLGALTRMLNTITKGIMSFVGIIMNVVNSIKSLVMGIVEKIVGFAKTVFFYIKCTLKILSNFHKCAIFYLLDIVKYCILFLPLLIVQISTGSDSKGIQKTLDKVDAILGWPNDIRNDCYRCKNRDGGLKNDFWKKLQKALQGEEVGFSFVFMLMISIVVLFFGYTINVLCCK